MTTLPFASRLALIGLAVCNVCFCARAACQTTQSDSITVSLSMENEQVAIGQSPWAILTVRNLSNHEIRIHGNTYRARVDGERGEPPTTQVQRQMTGRLGPGEAPLREDEYVIWTVAPGKSGIRKFQLTYLYDLSVAGKYSVYAEVMDPSTQKWLRSNTAHFTMQAP